MILDKIVRQKLLEIERSKKAMPQSLLEKKGSAIKKRRSLYAALTRGRGLRVIAEIKRKSPSKGLLRKNFQPERIARDYEAAGARALSVLTDQVFFGGSLGYLQRVRAVSSLPILRKDFILDEYQIFEAKASGADAILLIAAILPALSMKRFYAVAKKIGLEVLFEVHTEQELELVLPLRPRIVGINNRNLDTFQVDVAVTKRLARKIPSGICLVSESGLRTHEDLVRVAKMGASAFLVGEALMRQSDVRLGLERLIGGSRGSR